MEITRSQLCDIIGRNARTVRNWTGMDTFPKPIGRIGKAMTYDSHAVIAWYVDHESRRIVGGSVGEQDLELGGDDAPGGVMNLQAERALLARSQRLKIDLENAERQKRLIPVGVAAQALTGAVSAARAVLLSVHADIASTHPGLSLDVIDGIRKSHHDALRALSEAPVPTAEPEPEPEEVEP